MRTEKNVIFLVIIALALSLIALKVNFFSQDSNYLTGFATAGNTTAGKVNLSIESRLIINFTTDVIDWGSGRVDLGANNATLDTSRNSTDTKVLNGNWTGNFANRSRGLVLENIGNINVTLYLKTAKNATQFIGGSNPLYQFNVTNNKTNSCWQNESTTGNSSDVRYLGLGLYYDVNATSGEGTRVCDELGYEDTKDALRIDILLRVPSSSNTGDLEDTITATAYASS